MKSKFQFITIATLLLASFIALQAQRGWGGGMDAGKRTEHITQMLSEKLSLTDEQQAAIKNINSSFSEKMKAQGLDRDFEKMKALHEEHHAAIEKVLTTEQKEKFAALKSERHGEMGPHGKHARGNSENRQAMFDEMRTYREENIRPVMQEQRAALDPKIPAADQKAIASLREKINAAKKDMATMHEGKPEGSGFHKGHHGIMRTVMADEATRQQAEKLVETYGADIESIFTEIAPQREQWRNDLKAIHEKYRKDEAKNPHNGWREGKEPAAEKIASRDFHKKLRFLLMPAEATTAAPQPQDERNINVFPNPAGTIQHIGFEVLAAGKVQVDIVDSQGNIVKSVFKGELPKGLNKLEVNTSGLPAKMYYYRVTDAQGMTSKPFFIR